MTHDLAATAVEAHSQESDTHGYAEDLLNKVAVTLKGMVDAQESSCCEPTTDPDSPESSLSLSQKKGRDITLPQVVAELLKITTFLKNIGQGEALVGELLAGKFLRVKERLFYIKTSVTHKSPEVDCVVRRLLMCIGVLTRELKVAFGASGLQRAGSFPCTPEGHHVSTPSSFSLRQNSWTKIGSSVSTPTSTRNKIEKNVSANTLVASANDIQNDVAVEDSCEEKVRPRMQKFIPPPVEVQWMHRQNSPSSSQATPSHHSLPSTPLSSLSARLFSTFLRKTPRHHPSTPLNLVICRICEVKIPGERIEEHTETCLSRMTAMMVLEHVISRIKSCIVNFEAEKASLIQSVLENCQSMRVETAATSMAGTIRLIARSKSTCTEAYPEDTELCALIETAYDASTVVLRRQSEAKEMMVPSEMVDFAKLQSTTSVTLSDFRVEGVIARGAFGRVFLVEKKRTKDLYALKVLSQEDIRHRRMAQKLLNERDIMAFTNCNLLVQLHYSFASTQYVYFAMEWHSGGDVFSLLERCETLTEEHACFYIAEIFLALEHLHALSIVHRDIKPDNILLSDNGHLKLTDFGLSDVGAGFVVDSIISRADNVLGMTPLARQKNDDGGTPEYVAPEIILAEDSDKTADLWSLGVVLYEFMEGTTPFYSDTPEEIFDNILRCEYEPCASDCSQDAKDLIAGLLQFNPTDRITDLRVHPFFKDINWDTIQQSEAPYRPDLSKDNFKERREVYSVNDSDMDFLKEEIRAERRGSKSTVEEGSPRLGREFLRRRSGNVCIFSTYLPSPPL